MDNILIPMYSQESQKDVVELNAIKQWKHNCVQIDIIRLKYIRQFNGIILQDKKPLSEKSI